MCHCQPLYKIPQTHAWDIGVLICRTRKYRQLGVVSLKKTEDVWRPLPLCRDRNFVRSPILQRGTRRCRSTLSKQNVPKVKLLRCHSWEIRVFKLSDSFLATWNSAGVMLPPSIMGERSVVFCSLVKFNFLFYHSALQMKQWTIGLRRASVELRRHEGRFGKSGVACFQGLLICCAWGEKAPGLRFAVRGSWFPSTLPPLALYTPYSKIAANKSFFCLHVN